MAFDTIKKNGNPIKTMGEARAEAKFFLGPEATLKKANTNCAVYENKKTGQTYRVQR